MGNALLKNKEGPSGVCRLDCVPAQLSLHMETAGYVCLNRRYTHESVKAEAKRKLIYLLLRLCQQRDGVAEEFSLQRSSAPGHFYRLLFYLSILTGEKSLGGDSFEDSVEHHVVDFL